MFTTCPTDLYNHLIRPIGMLTHESQWVRGTDGRCVMAIVGYLDSVMDKVISDALVKGH